MSFSLYKATLSLFRTICYYCYYTVLVVSICIKNKVQGTSSVWNLMCVERGEAHMPVHLHDVRRKAQEEQQKEIWLNGIKVFKLPLCDLLFLLRHLYPKPFVF